MRREAFTGLVLAGSILAGCGSDSDPEAAPAATLPEAATRAASTIIATELEPGGVLVQYYQDGSRDRIVPTEFSELAGVSNIIIHETCELLSDGSGTLYSTTERYSSAASTFIVPGFPACSDGLLRPDEFKSINLGDGSK